ncbi:hypothetical protein [Kribbella sp. NPDC048928]|uniref:hypothetical protein n=1 Tax=Kribbella sp. NPDC048928 TaxID=3364111 RepID=UPI00371FDD7E
MVFGFRSAQQRAAVCDAMADAYAGDFRHVGLVRGLARQVAVQDVDNMIAASDVPRSSEAILDQRATGEPAPADIKDLLRQAAAQGFTETLGDHLRTPDVARNLLAESHGPGRQNSPMRTAATALFRDSAEAQAQIPPEQHANAISSIQQAMENEARRLDAAPQDLVGHSGLPPSDLNQTLDETKTIGADIAGAGIEEVDRLAHPPAPVGEPLQQAAAVDGKAAQDAASSGVAPAGSTPAGGTTPAGGSGRPENAAAAARVDPRIAYGMDSGRSGAREA